MRVLEPFTVSTLRRRVLLPLLVPLGVAVAVVLVLTRGPADGDGRSDQRSLELINESSFAAALAKTLTCSTTISQHPQYAEGSGVATAEEALATWIATDTNFQLSTLEPPELFDSMDRLQAYVMSSSDGVPLTITLGETSSGWIVDSVSACADVVRPSRSGG